jgi:hypothetical protein
MWSPRTDDSCAPAKVTTPIYPLERAHEVMSVFRDYLALSLI